MTEYLINYTHTSTTDFTLTSNDTIKLSTVNDSSAGRDYFLISGYTFNGENKTIPIGKSLTNVFEGLRPSREVTTTAKKDGDVIIVYTSGSSGEPITFMPSKPGYLKITMHYYYQYKNDASDVKRGEKYTTYNIYVTDQYVPAVPYVFKSNSWTPTTLLVGKPE